MIRRTILALGALLGATALAQERPDPRALSTLSKDGPPLLPFMLPSIPAVGGSAPTTWDGGSRAQAYAMVGREDRIVAESSQQPSTCTLANGDAVAQIVARARDAQVVMINEAHDSPRDRAFVADLAEALKGLGYATYAGETLNVSQSPGQYPLITDGTYSSEPAFGALLRALRRDKVRLVAYEHIAGAHDHVADVINERESGQASNLINQTVRERRDEKILVHVGYSHNRETLERLDRREIRWLALRFKEITGIDPLTIDQTSFGAEREGVCATVTGGAALPTDRDMFVAHAPLTFERHRPTWRLARGQRFAEIPRVLRKSDTRMIYEARYANEPDEAVPVDRLLVDPGEDIPLVLPPGRYRVRAWTEAGAWTRSVPLTVAAPAPPPQKTRPKQSRRKKT